MSIANYFGASSNIILNKNERHYLAQLYVQRHLRQTVHRTQQQSVLSNNSMTALYYIVSPELSRKLRN